MTNKTTKHLGGLNPQTFFCECGQGERGKCPAFHTENLRVSGLDVRTIAIITGIALMSVAVLGFGLWMAAKI